MEVSISFKRVDMYMRDFCKDQGKSILKSMYLNIFCSEMNFSFNTILPQHLKYPDPSCW